MTDSQRWQEWFDRLRQFVEREGNARVPTNYVTEDGYNLGTWVARQRQFYKQGKLSAERQKTLEQLPGWVWTSKGKRSPDSQKWQQCLNRLRQFVEREGNARVPTNYVTEDGYNLGTWVARQRHFYKQGKLSVEKQKALEELSGWVWGEKQKIWLSWSDALKYLQEYVKREGHASVPQHYVTEDGYKLGSWVSVQRHYYKQGKLSAEKQKTLEQLPGWVWGGKNKKSATGTAGNGIEYLRKYAESKGHTSVPYNYVTEDGYTLGHWINRHRQLYRQGKLSAEIKKTLEQLPGWVWRTTKTWTESFKALRKYAESGHTSIPASCVMEDGFNLGKWVSKQQYLYKEGKLSAEKQKALEQLPGWVWGEKRKEGGKWAGGLEHLHRYLDSEGHASVPLKYVTEDGYSLGIWVSNQRQLYKQGILSAERQKVLDQLPGWVWSIRKTINKNDV